MKKKILIISCVVLAAAVSCFGIYRAADSFLAKDTPEPGFEEADVQPQEDEEKNTVNEKTVSAKDETEVKAQPQASEPAEVPQEPEPQPDATKTVTANDKVWQLNFSKTDKPTIFKSDIREVYKYISEDGMTNVEYDCETGEMLYAYFNVPYDYSEGITAEQAKAIGEEFAEEHCDMSQYTFDSITTSGTPRYHISYSRHIDGYKSIQTVFVDVTMEGDILSFSNKKYIFDGFDTDIDIDGERTDTLLEEEVREGYGEDAEYEITYQCVDIGRVDIGLDGDELAMRYNVDISVDGKIYSNAFFIPIQQDD